jgi:hypothetical protein
MGFQPTLPKIWLAAAVLWIAGVLFFVSLDGLLTQELWEVVPAAFVPPLVPPIALWSLVSVIADVFRP